MRVNNNNLITLIYLILGGVIIELLAKSGRASAAECSLRGAKDSCSTSSKEPYRPNIVLFIADDRRSSDADCGLACPDYQKFKITSTNFNKAQTKFSVCGPSRASILLGREPDDTKVTDFETYPEAVDDGKATSLPRYLKNLGYDVRVIGKLYHPCNTERDTQIQFKSGDISYPIQFTQSFNGVCGRKAYCTDKLSKNPDFKIANAAVSYIKQRANNPEQPFFLALGLKNPHLTTVFPPQYLKMVKPDPIIFETPTIPGASDWQHSLAYRAYDEGGHMQLKFGSSWQPAVSAANGRRSIWDLFQPKYLSTLQQADRAYKAGIISVLAATNSVLSALNDYGLYNDTLVIETSDHGWTMQRRRWGKNGVGVQETRIPLRIHFPNQITSVENPFPTTPMNIFCTVIDVIGGPKLDKLACKSLAPAKTSADFDIDKGVITQYPRCEGLGSIQKNDCMTSEEGSSCINGGGRPAIKYMLYSFSERDQQNKGIWKLVFAMPYNDPHKRCNRTTWSNMPAGISSYGPAVWQKEQQTGTSWYDKNGKPRVGLQPELYFIPDEAPIYFEPTNNLAVNPTPENSNRMRRYTDTVRKRLSKYSVS